jgi:hypothetical protein
MFFRWFRNTNHVTDQLNKLQYGARLEPAVHSSRYIRQYGKMASGLEKAFSVLAFHETKSVVTMQWQFRRKYGKSPPSQQSIRDWYKHFVTDGLNWHRYISYCGDLWRIMSTSLRCRQHYTIITVVIVIIIFTTRYEGSWNHYMSSRHGSERPVQTIRKFFTTCDRRLNIGLVFLDPLMALKLNFINVKLMFKKLSVGTCFVRVT